MNGYYYIENIPISISSIYTKLIYGQHHFYIRYYNELYHFLCDISLKTHWSEGYIDFYGFSKKEGGKYKYTKWGAKFGVLDRMYYTRAKSKIEFHSPSGDCSYMFHINKYKHAHHIPSIQRVDNVHIEKKCKNKPYVSYVTSDTSSIQYHHVEYEVPHEERKFIRMFLLLIYFLAHYYH